MATALTQILVRAGETSREGEIISMQSFIYKISSYLLITLSIITVSF